MFSSCFSEIPVLETERLILRAFTPDDIAQYNQEFNNENIQKHLGGVLILKNEMDAQNWLKNINSRSLKKKLAFTWLITRKEDTLQSVGRIDLGGFANKKTAEISYYIWEKNWGNGYSQEAIKRVTRFGFDDLELIRIQTVIGVHNSRSVNTIIKSGFEKEGLLRKYPLGKSIQDVYIYSILNNDCV